MMLTYFQRQININRAYGSSLLQWKHYIKWKHSQRPAASSVKDEQPWITYDAIGFLNRNMKPEASVFEFGGGGSTFFFLKRAKEVITVEHDESWFSQLKETAGKRNASHWKGIYIPKESGDLVPVPDPSLPEHYSSADESSKGSNYRQYAQTIDSYQDGYFDVVLVDGRSRPACLKHALGKVKEGGYLVLDNSDRDYYLKHMNSEISRDYNLLLNATGPCPYVMEFTRTAIWQRK